MGGFLKKGDLFVVYDCVYGFFLDLKECNCMMVGSFFGG